ncbi:hypothetical protein JB92DRAFT_2910858 [Gautieria morchelliformis]|nr:hypothetical protein JB92DRAFT_2910858 [Gautieria morchelliformis]
MRAKMASGGLVFRPLVLSDWDSEHSVPWVHYVPVQPDLSDLPSLMAFLNGDALA